MTTCQWMQMTYSYGRVMNILSWKKATYPGGEHEIKMGESKTKKIKIKMGDFTPTHFTHVQHHFLLSIPIRNCSSHTKVNRLPLQVLPRVQLYMWPPLWAYRFWPTYCSAQITDATCAEATHFTSQAMHLSVTWSSLREGHGLYTSIWDWSQGLGLWICFFPGEQECWIIYHHVSSTGRKATSLVITSLKQKTP